MALRITGLSIALLLTLVAAPATAQDAVFTVAGTGVAGSNGDGADGPSVQIAAPRNLVYDGGAGLLFVDAGNYRVRRLDIFDLSVTTVAGNGTNAPATLGAAPTSTSLANPIAIERLPNTGALLIVESNPGRLLVLTGGQLELVAGNGSPGGAGDGGQASAAVLLTFIKSQSPSVGAFLVSAITSQGGLIGRPEKDWTWPPGPRIG